MRIIGIFAALGIVTSLSGLSCKSTEPTVPSMVPIGSVSAEPSASPAVSVAASSVTDAGPPTPLLTKDAARELKLISKMLKKVQKARALTAAHEVAGAVLERKDLIANIKKHVATEVPPEAIEREGMYLKLLGFLPTNMNYEKAVFDLLEAQLAGYYEPADGRMYLASDLDEDNANATLAHELVHALQDQNFNLKDRSKYKPSEGDRSSATSALAEGDAMSAMFDVLLSEGGKTALDLSDEMYEAQMRAGMKMGPGSTAPPVMMASLIAPYLYGTQFVNAQRRKGGWAAVDEVWKNPPTTTEQILHPEKWKTHEKAVVIPAATFAALGSGYSKVDSDSSGELGYRLTLEQWVTNDRSAQLSAHWGGDLTTLVKNGDQQAFAWQIRYDEGKGGAGATDAALAFQILKAALPKKVLGTADSDATSICILRPELGPLALARKGNELIFISGPTDTKAWKSTSTCKEARAWITELQKHR